MALQPWDIGEDDDAATEHDRARELEIQVDVSKPSKRCWPLPTAMGKIEKSNY
jgi:hypothetical protein